MESVGHAIMDGPGKPRILQGIRDHFRHLRESNGHATCHLPRWDKHWADSNRFKAADPRKVKGAGTPSLHADFVKVFPKDEAKDRKRPVYRIRVRMPQICRGICTLHTTCIPKPAARSRALPMGQSMSSG